MNFLITLLLQDIFLLESDGGKIFLILWDKNSFIHQQFIIKFI